MYKEHLDAHFSNWNWNNWNWNATLIFTFLLFTLSSTRPESAMQISLYTARA